ncbi:MAG TPA: DedA family protein [Proteus sp.]|uniref:DedA family inner membrane protein n=1 Tax=Proteus hauseri ATCC 700826 TaxID=1354271 RepID=A0AAJ3LUL2_PROHU|nr:DedA family protein [Proteus hauseri]OAT48493.1 DedA family inner membrane protein [Proteus hauseri ATCC 700826]QAV23673.1 DedA family protein [Proteus hauseri]HCH51474.1 DedA family protein [Proteus sp. (in: enterobacteria)]
MDTLKEIIHALLQHDYMVLADPNIMWVIYVVLFIIIMLENGILPAAFLPGDTLLVLCGALIAKDVLHFIPTIAILGTAASVGSWLGFLQGRWLSDTKIVKRWMSQLPDQYHQRANELFHRQGLYALLIGRFIAFVRTLLPTLAGLSELEQRRFHLFNWISGFLWVGIIVSLGYILNQIPFVQKHEQLVMNILMIIPVVLLTAGLIGSIAMYIKHRRSSANK